MLLVGVLYFSCKYHYSCLFLMIFGILDSTPPRKDVYYANVRTKTKNLWSLIFLLWSLISSLRRLWATRAGKLVDGCLVVGGWWLGSSICGLGSRSWSVNIEKQIVLLGLSEARALANMFEHNPRLCFSSCVFHTFRWKYQYSYWFLVIFYNLGFDVSQKGRLLRKRPH